MSKPTLSIIIPVFNEAENLPWHHEIIAEHLKKLKLAYELIYINDGSTDNSLEIIERIVKNSQNAQYINFSRNFGKEAATSAGLHKCNGEAAIMIDADGQHPIEAVDHFLAEWQKGYQVVVGVRKTNAKEGIVKRYGSLLFYKILNVFTEGNTVSGSTDFRLLDRKVINEYNKFTERNRITRGLIDWLGFKRTYIEFDASPRHAGNAAYSFKKLVKLAMYGLVSQTTKPLQLTGILGSIVTLLSAAVGIFLGVETYLLNDPLDLVITGTAILALFLSFLVGIVLICQWLLALYIESIHGEAQNRPLYIIADES